MRSLTLERRLFQLSYGIRLVFEDTIFMVQELGLKARLEVSMC